MPIDAYLEKLEIMIVRIYCSVASNDTFQLKRILLQCCTMVTKSSRVVCTVMSWWLMSNEFHLALICGTEARRISIILLGFLSLSHSLCDRISASACLFIILMGMAVLLLRSWTAWKIYDRQQRVLTWSLVNWDNKLLARIWSFGNGDWWIWH